MNAIGFGILMRQKHQYFDAKKCFLFQYFNINKICFSGDTEDVRVCPPFLRNLIFWMMVLGPRAEAGDSFAQLFDVRDSHPGLALSVGDGARGIEGLHWIDAHHVKIEKSFVGLDGAVAHSVTLMGVFVRPGWGLFFQGGRLELEPGTGRFKIRVSFSEGSDRLTLEARGWSREGEQGQRPIVERQHFLVRKFSDRPVRTIASVSRTEWKRSPPEQFWIEGQPQSWSIQQTLQSSGKIYTLGGVSTSSAAGGFDFGVSERARLLGEVRYRSIGVASQQEGGIAVQSGSVSQLGWGIQGEMDAGVGEESVIGMFLGVSSHSVPYLEFLDPSTLTLKSANDIGLVVGVRLRISEDGPQSGNGFLIEASGGRGLGLISSAATTWKSRDEYQIRSIWLQSLGNSMGMRLGLGLDYQKNNFVISDDQWTSSVLGVSGVLGLTFRLGDEKP